MTPGCRKPSFQFMVVFLVCFVNDRVRLRLPCQAPPVAIARAATQRRRRAANKKLKRNARSEERRVGKECVSTCRYRGTRNHDKNKQGEEANNYTTETNES